MAGAVDDGGEFAADAGAELVAEVEEVEEAVADGEAGGGGGRVGLHVADNEGVSGSNTDAANTFIGRDAGIDGEVDLGAVALDGEDVEAAASFGTAGGGDEGLEEVLPIAEAAAIEGDDAVADLEAGLDGGASDLGAIGEGDGGGDVADLGGDLVAGSGLADEPDDGSEEEGEDEVKGGAGGEDYHLGRVGNGGQALGRRVAFALDAPHIGQLREGDVAAEGEPGEAVFDAVPAGPGEDLGAEADGEAGDVHAALAGGEEVAEFMDED